VNPGRWAARAASIRTDAYALYLAAKDPRVPWAAKALVLFVLAYALSPVDLIPDWIPVLGFVDDLILVPLGVALAARLIPREILAEHRSEAARRFADVRPRILWGAVIIVGLWSGTAVLVAFLLWKLLAG